MNSISFKANFVHNAVIKSRKPNGRYKDEQVSMVKICNSSSDMNTLQNLSSLWGDETFVESILINYFYKKNNKDLMVYALTEQSEKYKNLQPKKILGLIEAKKNQNCYKINYLQTRPDCIHSERKKPFKGIGEALMKSIISLTGDKKIYLKSVEEAIDFYKKFGFKVVQDDIKEPLMLLKKL